MMPEGVLMGSCRFCTMFWLFIPRQLSLEAAFGFFGKWYLVIRLGHFPSPKRCLIYVFSANLREYRFLVCLHI